MDKVEHWISEQSKEYAEGDGFGQARRAIMRVSPRSIGFVDMVRQSISPEHRARCLVLDVGCNDGQMTKQLRTDGFAAVGLDLPEVIKKARVANPDCEFIDAAFDRVDAKELLARLNGRHAAVIYMAEVIEHLFDDAHALRTAWELLRPEGVLWIDTPATPEKIFESDHLRYYPLPSLAKLLAVAGFAIEFLGVKDTQNIAVGRKHL